MKGLFHAACVAVVAAMAAVTTAQTTAFATSRIKDLANIEGVRQNQLIGYGLVVGLNGTGDTLNNIPFTAIAVRCSSAWASTSAAPTSAPATSPPSW